MAAVVAVADLNRLIKLLGMLGSVHAGERAAAALKVTEWVAGHGTSWAELLDPASVPPVLSVGVGEPPRPAEPPATPTPARPSAPYTAPGAAPPPGGGGKGGGPGPFAAAAQQAYARSPHGAGRGGLTQLACWQAVAHAILARHPHVLKGDKEQAFIEGRLLKARFPLTDKQELWLRDIAARAGLVW